MDDSKSQASALSPLKRKRGRAWIRWKVCGIHGMLFQRSINMKRIILTCVLLLLSQPAFSQLRSHALKSKTPDQIFDPSRNAARDLDAAIVIAAGTGKRVLIGVGGNWCSWCHEMERFIDAHGDLHALRDRNYVTVRVNWSPENKNEAVLSKYPKIPGYPHLFVLDKNGTLLHSQDTSQIEDGKTSYNLEKFAAFLTQWAPAAK